MLTILYISLALFHSFCFDLLVASLCPSIFGQELVKAGLLLTLLGGTKRQDPSSLRTRVRIRSDPHILLVVRLCMYVVPIHS